MGCWKNVGLLCAPQHLLRKQEGILLDVTLHFLLHLKLLNPLSDSLDSPPPLWASLLNSWGRDTSAYASIVGFLPHPLR